MERLELLKSISVKNEKKILLMVMDGLGGIPDDSGRTELETANTPNMSALAKISQCGLTIPISYGITPGSGPAHLSLFGFDPCAYQIGRGILEALGIGMTVTKSDLCCRGNFATLDYRQNLVVDRRAGRIPTEKTEELCKLLQSKITKIEDIEVIIRPGKGHRFVVVLRGNGLAEAITDNDPQKEKLPPNKITALNRDSEKTAKTINTLIEKIKEIIGKEERANYVLIRGFSKYPDIPSMEEIFRLNPAAIATYPMYKGLAQLVGMKILKTGTTLPDEIETLRKEYANHDFFFMHIKETDAFGEDGNFESKVKKIEDVDKYIPEILSLKPDVLIITGDHSTPAMLKGHSWHNVPILIYSAQNKMAGVNKFCEVDCLKGSLGIFPAIEVMPLALANSFKLTKFGA